MKSLAVVSQKGGVGKTTLSLNLAYSLARSGSRVVLIDSDPQGAVGHSLIGSKNSPGLASLVAGTHAVEDALVSTRLPELRLLPVGEIAPDGWQAFAALLSNGHTLSNLLTNFEQLCDLVIIDTPSGFGGITLGVLRSVDYAVSPLQAEPIALRSLPQLLGLIGALRKSGSRVELIAIVLSMLQQRVSDSLCVAEEVWSRLPADLVAETSIPRDTAVLTANAAGVPLALMSRRRPSPLSLVFERLAAELAPRVGLQGEDDGPVSLFA